MTTCVLCGREDDFRKVYSDEHVRIVRCAECGLVKQQDCVQAISKLDKSFKTLETYYERRSLVNHCNLNFNQGTLARTADIQQKLKNTLGKNQRLLDVGCGTGEFVWALKESGLDAMGVEPDLARASFAREKLNVQMVTSPYKQTLIAPDTFDAITFIQVLEHMKNPLDILLIAGEHLKLGGLLVIDVPSFNNPRIIAYRLTHLAALVQRDFIPSHCYFFTRRTLSKLVEKAGFKVQKVQTGRYAVKFGNNPLTNMLDWFADTLGIGGITLYATKELGRKRGYRQ